MTDTTNRTALLREQLARRILSKEISPGPNRLCAHCISTPTFPTLTCHQKKGGCERTHLMKAQIKQP